MCVGSELRIWVETVFEEKTDVRSATKTVNSAASALERPPQLFKQINGNKQPNKAQ